MPSAPKNPHVVTARPAVRPIVYLSPVDLDGTPGPEFETQALRLIEIHRHAGGKHLDAAIFEYDLGGEAERIVDYELKLNSSQVEVRLPKENGSPDLKLLFRGDVTKEAVNIDRGAEKIITTARIEPYHFGDICEGMRVYNPQHDEDSLDDELYPIIHQDLLFNPEIDGLIKINRSSRTYSYGSREYHLWLDPESVTETPAYDFQDAGIEEWTLASAVKTLQGLLNPEETYIKNASDEEIDRIFEAAPRLVNVRLKRGDYLPEYLDQLLKPLGFDWFVRHTLDDDGNSLRTVAYIQRGSGISMQVRLQRPGSDQPLDLAKTNTEAVALETSLADLANVVVGQGSLQRVQLTLPLYRGWPTAQDALSIADTLKSDPESSYYTGTDSTAARNAWRRYVANEDGGFNGYRTEITEAPDLRSYFRDYIPKRRKLEACLDRDAAGKQIRPVLEYRLGGGPSSSLDESLFPWKKVPSEWGWQLLEDRIGIMFTGDEVPDELHDVAEHELRLTGTVVGDSRVTSTATWQAGSPTIRDIKLFLDLSDRFHYRKVATLGDFAAQRFAITSADERDDGETMRTFLEAIRNVEDVARMVAEFRLHGIHLEYEIGDMLTEVEGRRIVLNGKSRTSSEKRNLQITSVKYNFQEQTTTLTTEPEYLTTLDERLRKIQI